MGFRAGYKPGQKSAAFFSQATAGQTSAAKDVLAGGQGMKQVQQGGTQARADETKNVLANTTNVVNTNTDFKDNNHTQLQGIAQGASTPVVLPQPQTAGFIKNNGVQQKPDVKIMGRTIQSPTNFTDNKVIKNNDGTYTLNEGKAVTDLNNYYNNQMQGYASEQQGLADTLNKTGDVSAELQAESTMDNKRQSDLVAQNLAQEKIAGANNYGQISAANTNDIQSQQFLKQLAENNPSNVGLLSTLYGGGYNADKYGALDSNIYQGQLNQLKQGSQAQLQDRENKIGEMQQSLKGYYDQVGDKKKEIQGKYETEIGKNKADATQLEGIKSSLTTRIGELENAKAKAGPELRRQLEQKLANLRVEVKKANDKVKMNKDAEAQQTSQRIAERDKLLRQQAVNTNKFKV